MSENDFQPHSDEELARLLEEQMKALRPLTSPGAPERNDAVTSPNQADADENALDELFGALLDDSPSLVETTEVVSEKPVVDESALGLTQPIEYVSSQSEFDTVVSVEIEEEIVLSSEVIESVDTESSDIHAVAERVLQDIDTQGVVVATTVATTATSDPIPGMFGVGPDKAIPEMVNQPTFEVSSHSDSAQLDSAAEFVRRVRRQDSGFTSRPRFDDVVFGQDS